MPLYPPESEVSRLITETVELLAEQLSDYIDKDPALALVVADGLQEIVPALWPHLGRGEGSSTGVVKQASFAKQFAELMLNTKEMGENPSLRSCW